METREDHRLEGGSGGARIRAVEQPGSRTALLLLALLCVAGAVLRFTRLDFQSLRLDELASWLQSQAPDVAGVIARVRADVHLPAHPLILHALARCCGDSEAWLRLPSAFAGVLTIPALYAFVRRLYGVRAGLWAALLLAFGGTPILYSQEARPYALLLLGACTSGACWLELLRALAAGRRAPLGAGAGFVVSAIATAYLHYFGVLLVGLQSLALLAVSPRRAAPWLGAVALAALPWIPALREDAGTTRIWIHPSGLGTVAATWRMLFRRPGGLEWAMGALCLVFLVRCGVAARRERARPLRERLLSPTAIALAWLIAPIAIALAVSRLWLPIYTTRNLLIVLPAAYALAGAALDELVPARARAPLATLLALALLAGTVWSGHYYTRPRYDQFREAAAALAAHENETPGAVVWAVGVPPEYFDYYLTRVGARSRVDTTFSRQPDPPRALAERGPEWLWLLAGPRPPSAALRPVLDAYYEPAQEHRFVHASARLYKRRRAWRGRPARLR